VNHENINSTNHIYTHLKILDREYIPKIYIDSNSQRGTIVVYLNSSLSDQALPFANAANSIEYLRYVETPIIASAKNIVQGIRMDSIHYLVRIIRNKRWSAYIEAAKLDGVDISSNKWINSLYEAVLVFMETGGATTRADMVHRADFFKKMFSQSYF